MRDKQLQQSKPTGGDMLDCLRIYMIKYIKKYDDKIYDIVINFARINYDKDLSILDIDSMPSFIVLSCYLKSQNVDESIYSDIFGILFA